jgi:hypothetical protein
VTTARDTMVPDPRRTREPSTLRVEPSPARTVFHNSSITRSVSGSVGACHQVFSIPTPNHPQTIVEHPRRTVSTLGAHARAQRSTDDSTTSRHCPTPRLMHSERGTGQPFQGGSTGSHPPRCTPLGAHEGCDVAGAT